METETRLIGMLFDEERGHDVGVYASYEDREDSGRLLGIFVQWEDPATGEWQSKILKGNPELWQTANSAM